MVTMGRKEGVKAGSGVCVGEVRYTFPIPVVICRRATHAALYVPAGDREAPPAYRH